MLHTFAHQPWTEPTRYPGMCMWMFGAHFDRTETWWPSAGAWIKYQHRAQYLLQEGEFADNARVADDADVRSIHRRYPGGIDIWFVADAKETENVQCCTFPTAGRMPELWDAETGRIADAALWKSSGGKTFVTIDFKPSGSVFVVFRRTTDLTESPPPRLREPPAGWTVDGPWKVSFPVGWMTEKTRMKTVTFERLTDWTASADDDIRYFSGTATYEKTVRVGPRASRGRVVLDLGRVHGIAEVSVDGITLPCLWRPPYRIDISEPLKGKATEAKVRVKVTNNWKNRLIGDETLFAPDCNWWPEIVGQGEASPSGRSTFSAFRHWKKGDALQPSGLLGPVRIVLNAETD